MPTLVDPSQIHPNLAPGHLLHIMCNLAGCSSRTVFMLLPGTWRQGLLKIS
jgi:hypothetical protein